MAHVRDESLSVALAPFGELLKKHRLAAGLSREELADRARLSVKTISALEQGFRQKPYRDTIAALAQALELPEDARTELERASLRRTAQIAKKSSAMLNLPRAVTPLVDRYDEVNSIVDLISRNRLVTITGSGGVGKTRVSLAVAERYPELKVDDVAFVDLSPLARGSLIVGTVATALGVPAPDDSTGIGMLTHHLRNSASLIILDNCEHLIDEVAGFVNTVLQTCPAVVILATSRERLDVPGEALFRLPSLTFPDDETPTAASVDSYSAIRLFVERAKAVEPSFGVTDENVTMIADICRRLEGIPLAIEIVAARLPVLGLPVLRTRIDDCLSGTLPTRGVPSRHATMHATIAWSYELLDERERILLNRLAIFVGGFTLDTAERVCADERLQSAEVTTLLTSLINKSLVNVSLDVEPARYRLLDSVRAYALDRLAHAEDTDSVARRRASWLLDLTTKVEQSRRGWAEDLSAVLSELSNIRAALQWGLDSERERDTVTAGRIAGGLRGLWLRASRVQECRFWTESLIQRIDEARYPHVVAQLWAGLVQTLGEAPEAAQKIEHALSLFERIGDFESVLHLRGELGRYYILHGSYARAEDVLVEALDIAEKHHLEHSSACVHAVGHLAIAVSEQGRSDEARASVKQALESLPPSEQNWRRWLTTILSEIEFNAGNTVKALEIAEDANRRFRHSGADRAYLYVTLSAYYLIMNDLNAALVLAREVITRMPEMREDGNWAIQLLAAIGALQGSTLAAARLLGFVDEWCKQNEISRSSFRQSAHDVLVRALRDRIPEAATDLLKAEGRALTYNQAIDEALTLAAVN